MGHDVVGTSHGPGTARSSDPDTVATLIRDERPPPGHETSVHSDAGDQVNLPAERIIWSPFRLQRRRRSEATPTTQPRQPATR